MVPPPLTGGSRGLIILEKKLFVGAVCVSVREGGIYLGNVRFVRLFHNSPVSSVNGRTDALVVWQIAGQAAGEGGAVGLSCVLGANLVFVKQAGDNLRFF